MKSRFDSVLLDKSGSCSTVLVKVQNGSGETIRTKPVCLWHRDEARLKYFEACSDPISYRDTRKSWNKFEHYKKVLAWPFSPSVKVGSTKFSASPDHRDFFSFSSPTWGYRSENGFGPVDSCSFQLPSLYNASGSEIVPDPPNVNDLMAHSMRAMLPKIRSEMSLVNSLIELKDFKSLPRTISKMKELIFPKRKRHLTLYSVFGALADSYLQSQFNILPLLDDIAKLAKSVRTFRSEVSKLLQFEKRRLRRHYYFDVGAPYIASFETKPRFYTYLAERLCVTSVTNNPEVVGIDGKTELSRDVRYDLAKFHAELEFTYYFTNYQREHAFGLGLLDKFGVNLNPTIIWNAIPWSFLVDWTLGVSRYLDQFERGNLEPVTVIHRYLWSWRVKRRIKVSSQNNLEVPWLSPVRQDTVWIEEESYKRVPCTPNIYQALEASGISAKEFSLASALVFSRKPGKR